LQHPPKAFRDGLHRQDRLCSDSLLRKNKRNGCAATNLAVNAGRAAMKIDNGFYQSQAQTCSVGAARLLGTVKTVKQARQMFGSYSAAVVANCDFHIVVVFGKHDLD